MIIFEDLIYFLFWVFQLNSFLVSLVILSSVSFVLKLPLKSQLHFIYFQFHYLVVKILILLFQVSLKIKYAKTFIFLNLFQESLNYWLSAIFNTFWSYFLLTTFWYFCYKILSMTAISLTFILQLDIFKYSLTMILTNFGAICFAIEVF